MDHPEYFNKKVPIWTTHLLLYRFGKNQALVTPLEGAFLNPFSPSFCCVLIHAVLLKKSLGKYDHRGRTCATASCAAPDNRDKSQTPGGNKYLRQDSFKWRYLMFWLLNLIILSISPLLAPTMLIYFPYLPTTGLSFRGHSRRLKKMPTKQGPTWSINSNFIPCWRVVIWFWVKVKIRSIFDLWNVTWAIFAKLGLKSPWVGNTFCVTDMSHNWCIT